MDWDWIALGTALRSRRKDLRLTQEELAGRAGVHTGTIKDYEAGKPYTRMPKSWAAIERAVSWAPGSALAVLKGGAPTVIVGPDGVYPPPQDPYQPLSERLPVSILNELTSGEVYAADIHDLTQDGGMRIITVAIRHPNEPAQQGPDTETRRRNYRAWSRMQRQIKGLEPLPWEPGDPEEWKEDETG